MKKNNKINKIVILTIVGVIFSVSLIIFILNYTKDSSSFSLKEKSWLANNSNNVIDVSVYNDVPVFGNNGEGIIFSFLDKFYDSYGISFNKVSYIVDNEDNLKDMAFRIVNYDKDLTKNDILLYKDYYVVVGNSGSSINTLSDLSNLNIGVLDSDVEELRYYLMDSKDVTFTSFEDCDKLINALSGKLVDYVIMPYNLNLDVILDKNLSVLYHLNELYKKYVLTVNNNGDLLSIMNKFYTIYNDTYLSSEYNKFLLNSFFDYKKISDNDKVNYNSSSYTFGYYVDMPYQNKINGEFVGILSNYLSDMEDNMGLDFKLVKYKSSQDLKDAFNNGKVDFVFQNFDTTGMKFLETVSPFSEEYVILSEDYFNVNSVRSLKNMDVISINNSKLYHYFAKNNVKVKGYNDSDELLRNVSDDSIVVIDKDTYFYYKDKKFRNFKILFEGVLPDNYSFIVRDSSDNKTFYELLNFYVQNVEFADIRYEYNTSYIVNNDNQLSDVIKYVLIGCGFILVLFLGIVFFLKSSKNKKNMKKEDKLKYIDVMTSLKNRNYLNNNIKIWDENEIYPQTIIIVDLNNIKYINDNYGHTEGDEVIKKAASILINNQEANSDIIRTDGNEFLIYMVGYDEKSILEYTRRLIKDLKELPHGFGAALGYSMILNDVKTIDDAINEATLSMRQAKDKL